MKLSRFITLTGTAVLSVVPAQANLSFNFTPDAGTPQYAIDGFNAAANLWSSVIADNITVNIDIGFSSLGAGILGSTTCSFVEYPYTQVYQALSTHLTSVDDYSSFATLQTGSSYSRLINHTSDNPNGPNSATPYVDTMNRVGLTTANARVLGLVPQNGSVDATIRFSSDFAFDFNHGSTITPGQYDFVGVAAHEIGHALGFVSGVDDIDTFNGTLTGGDFSSNMVDLFRFSADSLAMGAWYTDYTADGRSKYFSVDGGKTPLAYFATGVNYGDGNQASHFGKDSGTLMDPELAPGEKKNISLTDQRIFDVMGYTLVPEPDTLTLFGAGLLFLVVGKIQKRVTVKA